MKVKGISKMKDLQAADDRTEEQIQTEILQYLATIPLSKGFFYRTKPAAYSKPRHGHHKTENGQPDITGYLNIGAKNSIYIGLEVKRPKGVMLESQEEFQKKCDQNGAIYRVVTSVEDAQRVIEEVSG